MSQATNDMQQSRTFLIASGIRFPVCLGWPSSSFPMLGLFFGINLVMKGAAQFALGLAPRSAAVAA